MSGGLPGRWRPQPHLFQVNTWVWLDALEAQSGRKMQLADVPDSEFDRLGDLGFDLVYLLGIWRRSLAGRRLFRTDASSFRVFDHALPDWTVASVIGSPFSVEDYSPDPRIGTWEQLDAVRAKLHARGMRLILDFVPNHAGPDHPWIRTNPDYLLRGSEADFHRDPSAFILVEPEHAPAYFVARGRDPYFAPWADTAQIDYFNPATRAALITVLTEIGRHCDGLRCDMAMLVLNEIFAKTWAHLLNGRPAPAGEFWTDAIGALPANFLWMAEVYWDMEAELQQLGFNFTYDKRLYDRLVSGDPGQIRAHLSADFAYQGGMARFLENHDEPRAAATFARGRLPSLAALIATLPGLRFFHQGQFEGKTIHVPMPLNRAADEAPDAALARAYEKVIRIADDKVFHEGDWSLMEVHPDNDGTYENLIAYRWSEGPNFRLVVINLTDGVSHGRIPLSAALAPAPAYDLTDLLTDQVYVREHADLSAHGLYVRLAGYEAHVFSVAPSGAGSVPSG